jgi:alkanesulfonate monooxygenase SsuD/methylene tetrahydromethanopterin reductase-like flavin-dependent oxidoreductase (luciferase family)
MLGHNIFAADSEEDAERLFSSHQQAFVNSRSGRPGRLPPPKVDFAASLDPRWRALLDQMLSCRVVGTPNTVAEGLKAFVERTGADEIMVTGQIYDHAARKRSFEIAAHARDEIAAAEAC